MGLCRADETLRDSLETAMNIPLNSREETKIKGEPCQILEDSGATHSTLNLTLSGAYGFDPGKTGRSL